MKNSIQQAKAGGHWCPVKYIFSRRSAMVAGVAAALGALTSRGFGADNALQDIVDRTEQQAKAFVAGDMERWIKLIRISNDFTLMQPFGGPASHGFDPSPAHLAQLAKYFRGGKATIDVQKSYVTPEMIVLVMIERQDGEVGGLPNQDWSLRVTQVYRRDGGGWQLVHRHADPLVRKITLDQTASLARGS